MNHQRLKSAVNRYAGEDLKPTQLLAALQADDKKYTPEEVDEIFEAVMAEKKAGPAAQPDPAAVQPGANSQPEHPYVVCDIWHGSWVATDRMMNPRTGQFTNIEFVFEKKGGGASRKGIKVERRRMDALNEAAHINITGVNVEQLIPVDHEGPWTYKRLIIDGIPQ
jgi:hypothetical protein